MGIIFLFSFSSKNAFNTSIKSVTKLGTCATPYNLSAVKNGSSVTLNWSGDPITHGYGGYYSYYDQYGQPCSQNFGGSTNTWPTSISVPSSTYRITFTVTAYCTDGTYSTSSPVTVNF